MLDGIGVSPNGSPANSLDSKSFGKDITEDILRCNEENGLHLSPPEFDIEAASITVGNLYSTSKGKIFYITPEETGIPVAPFYPGVPDSMSFPAAQRLTCLYGSDKDTLRDAVMAMLFPQPA